jgi:prepilin-type N-terminal cleavage/methylation domain-containing protein/prepilin-type processing-associated H-X9-DG protein
MFRRQRGFTLIELLVVIAIIAILAAILFPVFASAKSAAKKTVDLSGLKQTATAGILYMADYDDSFMRGIGWYSGFGSLVDILEYSPYNWSPSHTDPRFLEADKGMWANSIQPYMKSWDLLASPAARVVDWPGVNYSSTNVAPGKVNFTYNGDLQLSSSSIVVSPSKVPMFSQLNGTFAVRGFAYTNPELECSNDAHDPSMCHYVPATGPDCFETDGAWDYAIELTNYFNADNETMWVHSNGINVSFVDSSAKYRKVGANINGKTDFRTDPFTNYDSKGRPSDAWYDQNYCHALQFAPDFDFSNYGTPFAGQ